MKSARWRGSGDGGSVVTGGAVVVVSTTNEGR
jgi:hypothetical protein